MEKKAVVKNYIFLGIMLGAMVLGAIVGWMAPAKAVAFFKPFGTVFINMMFCVVVPMVFCSIASAIANMKSVKRAGKLVSTAGDVLRIVRFLDDDRLSGIHLASGLEHDLTIELDAPVLDHLCSGGTGLRETAAHQLGVDSA